MPTLVLDPPPAELEAALERRHRFGADTHDEMWQDVLHLVPAPGFGHATLGAQLKSLLRTSAAAAGLTVTDEFNLGEDEHDFRVPDGGLHRPGATGTWLATAALALEVVSPGDESWEKLPFYAARGVDEVLIVDPQAHAVHWLALGGDSYQPIERSTLIELSRGELAEQLDWPAGA